MKPRDLQEIKSKVAMQLQKQIEEYEKIKGIRKGDTIEFIIKIKVK